MTRQTFSLLERFMLQCTADSAHDAEHIYRVLYSALQIAKTEPDTDMDVLVTACLLHDVGRPDQLADPQLCHAQVGAEKAYTFLVSNGFEADFAEKVRHCIRTHRFRKAMPPETLEARILFDADKLDVTGAMGIARTLMYRGAVTEPLYAICPDGSISDGNDPEESSFFREYKFKLEKLYDRFYTPEGARLAQQRKAAAVAFYESLYREIGDSYQYGHASLEALFTE